MSEELAVLITTFPAYEGLPLPRYMSAQAAGMDVYAAVAAEVVIPPGAWCVIPTGIAIALPAGYEAQVRPRSGLAVRYGVTIANTPGTIDADYRGEIGIILINHGERNFVVRRGDRIAQLVVQSVCRVSWARCRQLPATGRGEGGFGHTEREPYEEVQDQ